MLIEISSLLFTVAVAVGFDFLFIVVLIGVIFSSFVPVFPVQSYSFGWMHPFARVLEADGQVTEPCLLGQHWSPAQEPQSPSGQHGTGASIVQCNGAGAGFE